MTKLPRIAGLAEVAGLAGVSRKRAWQITQTRAFPVPAQVLAMGPVWLESDVAAYIAEHRPEDKEQAK